MKTGIQTLQKWPTITFTENIKPNRIYTFVWEAFDTLVELNKENFFTAREYDFPDRQIISALDDFTSTMPISNTITCTIEFDHLNNRVDVYCRYCSAWKKQPKAELATEEEYRAVKIFSGRWLKSPFYKLTSPRNEMR
jgi:hypothetical protein